MEKLSLFEILFSKDDQDEKSSADKGKFVTHEFSGSVTKSFQRFLSFRAFKIARAFSYLLSHVSTKVYGALILAYGAAATLMYFLHISADDSIVTPIVGLVAALISIPFLLADKPLPMVLQEFVVTDFIFFDLFCMKRHAVIEEEKKFPISVAVIIGLVTALISAVVPLWQITLVIAIMVCVYVSMESPEFIFLVSLFAIPYLRFVPNSDTVLGIALILAVISFLRKVLYGKRVLYIEQYDMIIGVMLLFVLISGVFVKGIESFSSSVRMVVFAIGYILASNVITNRRLADRTVNSIIISGSIASVISITQLVALLINTAGVFTAEQLNAILARADGMTVFFVVTVIFSVGMIGQSQMPGRVGYIVSSVLSLTALLLTGEIFAFWAVVLGFGAFMLIKYNKLVPFTLPLLVLLALAPMLLPERVLDAMFYHSPSITSAKELFALWSGSIDIFARNLFVGIGIGSDSFAQEMAGIGSVSYPNSSNLLIELGLEAGVFALICLLLLFAARLRHRAMQYIYVRNSQIEIISGISGAGLLSLIAFGMVNYIWSDLSAYYLFWCVFGIGSAALRVAKKDYDDKVSYYEETSDHDSSMIDIEIG